MDGQKMDLDKDLPSKKEFYDKFDGEDGTECTNIRGGTVNLTDILRQALAEYSSYSYMAFFFTKAYCLACKRKEDFTANTEKSHLKEAPCQAFYHWMGKTNSTLLDEKKLKGLVENIYTTLGSYFGDNKCNVTYADVDNTNELFKHRRKLFEHYYDCLHVRKYLEQVSDATKDGNWAFYKNDVDSACKSVGEHCAGNNDPYCKEYNNTYKYYCNGIEEQPMKCPTLTELPAHSELQTELQEETETEPEVKSTALEFSGSGHERGDTAQTMDSHFRTTLPTGSTTGSGAQRGSPIVSTAVGGTLFTLGLPLAAFLSYKYDLLPSSISNRLKNIVGGGSSRSRRVRSVRRNFDGSTADDASTVGSTLGDDSTVDYSTAEDVSTIYDDGQRRQPTGRTRTRTNNGRSGNIRYYAT
ncbi:KIR protein [Plasmodium knowlesi strain H]|uniref:KIR protein n=3 Tax=Plasmodium knowlesi TaxID=5850 RepID=A0A5K1VRJ9_PLAKH|nr:KIR protein [Plasmodium knowlesi strain H]OTN68006.1 KIR protein [Plasmodium knowlesi]CAA9990182.1 KIR protein [Plasmodium knowlesi strain H]SBO27463.1 KIR protein [Plasmodium knowlesi strain H]SBO28494.1 KIR protein [Plasmodium knowlesi strain H]VVS79656.1 KIR protein [Plasmodium knowlesi strain H]|eukprot:XP_002258119.1 KIR protein [Plasmodium knowlesi strain H]